VSLTACSLPPAPPPQGEEAETTRVQLAQDLGKGNAAERQSRFKLHEVSDCLAAGAPLCCRTWPDWHEWAAAACSRLPCCLACSSLRHTLPEHTCCSILMLPAAPIKLRSHLPSMLSSPHTRCIISTAPTPGPAFHSHAACLCPPPLPQIGPRLELELLKVEEGMCDGKVLFHRHVSKTPEEAAALEERQSSKEALKAQRRATQVCRGVQSCLYAVYRLCVGLCTLGVSWCCQQGCRRHTGAALVLPRCCLCTRKC
jgi:hypothetical protein